jgi:uncharacterized damage-inducible protein DinB
MKYPLAAVLVLSAAAHGQQAPASGYRAEFLASAGALEKKFVSLAEQIPEGKLTWRPGEGVRSVSEVFLHVSAANFGLTRMIGTPPPAGFQSKGFETSTTEKAKIVEHLKQSFAHLRQAVLNLSDGDADKPAKVFGRESTYRGALLAIAEHLGEHLGQSIAYARVNGVVPPWTEEAQRRQR